MSSVTVGKASYTMYPPEHHRDERLPDEEPLEPPREDGALLGVQLPLRLVELRLELLALLGVAAEVGELRLELQPLELEVDHLRRVEEVLEVDAGQLLHLALHPLDDRRVDVPVVRLRDERHQLPNPPSSGPDSQCRATREDGASGFCCVGGGSGGADCMRGRPAR